MWIVLVVVVAVAALVAWRLVAGRREVSRPVDSGHPHLTDVDPHGSDGASP